MTQLIYTGERVFYGFKAKWQGYNDNAGYRADVYFFSSQVVLTKTHGIVKTLKLFDDLKS